MPTTPLLPHVLCIDLLALAFSEAGRPATLQPRLGGADHDHGVSGWQLPLRVLYLMSTDPQGPMPHASQALTLSSARDTGLGEPVFLHIL